MTIPRTSTSTHPCTPPTRFQVPSAGHSHVFGCTLQRYDTLNRIWVYAAMYASVWPVHRLAELQAPGTRRSEAWGVWWVAGGWWHIVPEIVTFVDIIAQMYLWCSNCNLIRWFLMVMVLRIAALYTAELVDNWIMGRADHWLRYASGICCILLTNCQHM